MFSPFAPDPRPGAMLSPIKFLTLTLLPLCDLYALRAMLSSLRSSRTNASLLPIVFLLMDLVFAALPIGFLIFVMTKKKGMPSTVAFALAALLTYIIRIAFFKTNANLAHAAILSGLLQALTPISIVFGAIFFFVALERSGAMQTLTLWLDGVSRNPVAQLMIVGWSFIFLIEGASGFGTPAALAAPILVGLGFPPLRVAVLCIVMNTVPTSFGAVGTPNWFGFGSLGLAESQLLEIGLKAALMHAVAAVVIPVIALRLVVDWKEIRRNLLFVELAIFSSVLPMAAVATFNYEFPSVVGGAIGLLLTIFLAKHGIGLAEDKANTAGLVTPGIPIDWWSASGGGHLASRGCLSCTDSLDCNRRNFARYTNPISRITAASDF
jgi:lactate permease